MNIEEGDDIEDDGKERCATCGKRFEDCEGSGWTHCCGCGSELTQRDLDGWTNGSDPCAIGLICTACRLEYAEDPLVDEIIDRCLWQELRGPREPEVEDVVAFLESSLDSPDPGKRDAAKKILSVYKRRAVREVIES